MRVLVVDDEPLGRRAVVRALGETLADAEVIEACDGFEALAAVKERAPDLVFLDVEMPELSGLDVLRQLPSPRPKVVFVTAFSEFAVDAFAHDACDYVVKPFTTDRLAAATRRACSEIDNEARLRALEKTLANSGRHLERLALRLGARVDVVAVSDVACFVSKDHYTYVHAGSREYISELSLVHLEERLDPARFVRVHRNAIVNIAHVSRVTEDAAILANGMSVAVSRRNRAALLSRL